MQVIEGSMWNKVWLKFKEWTIRSVSLLIFWQGDKRHFSGGQKQRAKILRYKRGSLCNYEELFLNTVFYLWRGVGRGLPCRKGLELPYGECDKE